MIRELLALLAGLWNHLVDWSSTRQGDGRWRAAAFVRYSGADHLGHVGWAFDFDETQVNVGSVENTRGTPTCDPNDMGYWQEFATDPMPPVREKGYNDLKFIDLDKSVPVAAYGVVKWIATQPYDVVGRNCLDDTYDVLRAYGAPDLPLPVEDLLPTEWFIALRGEVAPVASYVWQKPPISKFRRALNKAVRSFAPMRKPTWRMEGHPDSREFQSRLSDERKRRAAQHHDTTPRSHAASPSASPTKPA